MNSKDTNPKDAVGIRKVAMSAVPAQPLMELGLAMMEGARKYGRHNYRVADVRGSVYYDAALRHLMAWWEGEDIDPDSGLSHLVKAMACLTVIRDAMLNDNWTDDRPPSMKSGWQTELNKKAGDLIDRLPDSAAAYTRNEQSSFPEYGVGVSVKNPGFNLGIGTYEVEMINDKTTFRIDPKIWASYLEWIDRQEISPRDYETTLPQPSPSVGNPAQLPLALGYIDPKQNAWNPLLERAAPGGSGEGPLEEQRS